ncbi:hypothetical protein [Salininema proteolyticum]|uniref:ABC transporter permease n=1 Tax=Salininema proteolyticum TaxID=1607685 RepID=A0ABV8TYZ6_9ACTN
MTRTDTAPTEAPTREPDRRTPDRLLPALLGAPLLLAVLLTAFALPASKSEPHDLPIALVAPEPVAAKAAEQLDGVADLHPADGPDETRDLIERREVYGALIVGPDGVEVQTATAAGPAVAGLLDRLGERLAAQADMPLETTDVVPTAETDPNGTAFTASAFPLAVGGIIIAALLTAAAATSAAKRATGAVLAPLLGAAALAGIMVWPLESIDAGDYPAAAGALALTLAAVTWTVLGLHALAGRVGLAIGAATVMLLGNPLSGMTSAPEMLPEPWGAVGQGMPPGAGATLLRTVVFFPEADYVRSAATLGIWLFCGAVLFWIGTAVKKRAEANA